MTETVEVTLPSSTNYVSGTVNGILVVWTNTTGNTWVAEAERAADDIYMLELSIVDENGGANFMSLVLFYGGLNLVTDRTENDVARWKELKAKGWSQMTADEQAEWLGDPMAAAKAGKLVNLMKMDTVFDGGATAEMQGDSIVVTSTGTSGFRYASVVLGDAKHFENQTVTLSCAGMETDDATAFKLHVYWVDSTYEYSIIPNAFLTEPGKVTFNCGENKDNRAFLAVLMYVATTNSREAGATVRYEKVMFELGSTAHDYMPYVSFVLTPALKGTYSYRDMNRVEGAVKLLAERFSELGYPHSLEVKTNWSQQNVPSREDMERYLGNVAELRALLPVLPETPPAPSIGDKLDYSSANNMEKILLDLSQIHENITQAWCYAGEIFSEGGMENGI